MCLAHLSCVVLDAEGEGVATMGDVTLVLSKALSATLNKTHFCSLDVQKATNIINNYLPCISILYNSHASFCLDFTLAFCTRFAKIFYCLYDFIAC